MRRLMSKQPDEKSQWSHPKSEVNRWVLLPDN